MSNADFDFSHFTKTASDKKTTTLKHPKGHEIKIAISGLTPEMRAKLEKMPLAKGGAVQRFAEGGQPDTKAPEMEGPRAMDPVSPAPVPNAPSDGIKRTADGMIDAGEVTPSSFYDTPAPAAPEKPKAKPKPAPEPPSDFVPQANTEAAPPPAPAPQPLPDPPEEQPLDANQMTADDMAWANDLKNGHIHPKTYNDLYEDKSTLGKIGTLFGLLVGGTGGGMTHQPNALLEMMNKEIDRDLDAQKASKNNAVNYLRLSQQHELQEAQIAQMGYENALTAAKTGAVPSEIALTQAKTGQVPSQIAESEARAKHLKADADYIGTNAAINRMKIGAYQSLQDQVDRIPPTSPTKAPAAAALNGTVAPAIMGSISEGNAKTAAAVNTARTIRKATKPTAPAGQQGAATPPTDTGVDWMKFNLLQKQGQMNSSLGMPGGMTGSDTAEATKEATAVQDNRAMMKNFLDSYDKLDKMALAGHLSPGYRSAQINTIAASIARETAGRYNASEAAAQMDGMFPAPGDWNSTRKEKRAKAIDYFRSQEAGTPTLDRFGLKTPFPSGGTSDKKAKAPAASPSAAPAAGGKEETVKIKNPHDGSVRTIPKSQADKYIKKGGIVVQ